MPPGRGLHGRGTRTSPTSILAARNYSSLYMFILTSWDIRPTCCHTSHPPMGNDGYAVKRKCWKKRRSSLLKDTGAVRSDRTGGAPAGTGAETETEPGDTRCSGYQQPRPSLAHGPHSGVVSSHFTLRLLQVPHPALDFLCPLRGTGRRLSVGGCGLLRLWEGGGC